MRCAALRRPPRWATGVQVAEQHVAQQQLLKQSELGASINLQLSPTTVASRSNATFALDMLSPPTSPGRADTSSADGSAFASAKAAAIADEQLKSALAKLKHKTALLEQSEARSRELGEQIEKLRADQRAESARSADSKVQLVDATTHSHALQNSVELLQAQLAHCSAREQHLSQRAARAEERSNALVEEEAALEAQLRKAEAAARSNEKELQQRDAQLAAEREQGAAYRKLNTKLNAEVDALAKASAAAMQDCAALQQQLEKLSHAHAHAQSEGDAARACNTELRTRNSQLSEKLEQLTQQCRELAASQATMAAHFDAAQSRHDECARTAQQLTGTVSSLWSTIKEQKIRNRSQLADREQTLAEMDSASQKLASLQQAVVAADGDARRMEGLNAELFSSLQLLEDRHMRDEVALSRLSQALQLATEQRSACEAEIGQWKRKQMHLQALLDEERELHRQSLARLAEQRALNDRWCTERVAYEAKLGEAAAALRIARAEREEGSQALAEARMANESLLHQASALLPTTRQLDGATRHAHALQVAAHAAASERLPLAQQPRVSYAHAAAELVADVVRRLLAALRNSQAHALGGWRGYALDTLAEVLTHAVTVGGSEARSRPHDSLVGAAAIAGDVVWCACVLHAATRELGRSP